MFLLMKYKIRSNDNILLLVSCRICFVCLFVFQAAVKTALRMNDPHFAMSIYEEAGDVYFKGHRNRMASLPFYRVKGYFKCTVLGFFFFGFFNNKL